MKRLPCLTRSVNITFIKTKRGICLSFMVPVQFFLLWRFFRFSMVYYCDLQVTNPVMTILQIMFVKTFLVTSLVWHLLFFAKITMCAFIVIGSSTKFCHGTNIVILSTNLHSIKKTTILELQSKFFFIW